RRRRVLVTPLYARAASLDPAWRLAGAPEPDRRAPLRWIGTRTDCEDAGTRLVQEAATANERARKAERAALLAGVPRGPRPADAAKIAAESRRPARTAHRAVAPIGDPLVDVADHVERAPRRRAARPGAGVGRPDPSGHARRGAVIGRARIRRAGGGALPRALRKEPLPRQGADRVPLRPPQAPPH